MPGYSLTHVADSKLAQDLRAGVSEDRTSLALRLAQIADFDHRRLYLPAYPSMYQYCLGELKYSEDAACRRLAAARLARRYPEIYTAIANGQHTLSTILMLENHLLPESAHGLVEGSSGMTKSGVAHFLAERFPRPDVPTLVQPIEHSQPAAAEPSTEPTLDQAPASTAAAVQEESGLPAPARVSPIDVVPATQRVVPVVAHTRLTPLSPTRYAIQVTVSKATHDKLRQAQALLSHSVPSGDVAEVLDRALDALIAQLEKRKYGATDRPRHARPSKNPRHVSAHVRRAVRARDGDRCTYVDEHGKRCNERKFLELDHVEAAARGGEATVSNLRLRCRAHNQYEAERTYGAGFMRHKRERRADRKAPGLTADRSTQPPGP